MPDWAHEVRSLLANPKLKPQDEDGLVEELADDAEERYEGKNVPKEDALWRFPSAAPTVAPGSMEKKTLSSVGRDPRLAGRQLRQDPVFGWLPSYRWRLGSEPTLPSSTLSFVSQRNHRVDACRTPRRDIASQNRHCG
jgi:hypothetical protein